MTTLKETVQKNLCTGRVILDLQKAFDTIDHEISCNKLKAMGVADTKWFHSYLTNRNLLNVNRINSDLANITCGVPQGSILGPLLFLCYVKDMSISIDKDCNFCCTPTRQRYLICTPGSKLAISETRSCATWLVDNKLSLHLGKIESIIFGSKRKRKRVNSFSVRCGDHNIASQEKVKYLGLTIDNILSGKEIVNGIIQKETRG